MRKFKIKLLLKTFLTYVYIYIRKEGKIIFELYTAFL